MPQEQSAGKPTTRRYSEQEKAAAVRMVRTLRAETGSEHGTVKRVADQLGYGVEWVRQADIDDGQAPGVSTDDKAARRAGLDVGRDQVARLMRAASIEGARRSKRVRTTQPDPGIDRTARHPDLVERAFRAEAPNRLWVTDLTYVATWAGVAYVCFIVDAYSRMIVGWRVASHMRTTMVLDALEMARWSRGTRLEGLRCHSDAGSQFTSLRYGERLAELGAVPSIGSVGDSFDNALAETVNGYYKAELVRGPARSGPWKTVEDVELATLGWVHWHNTARLHGYLGDVPPIEYEQAFYAAHRADHDPVGIPS